MNHVHGVRVVPDVLVASLVRAKKHFEVRGNPRNLRTHILKSGFQFTLPRFAHIIYIYISVSYG